MLWQYQRYYVLMQMYTEKHRYKLKYNKKYLVITLICNAVKNPIVNPHKPPIRIITQKYKSFKPSYFINSGISLFKAIVGIKIIEA